MDITSVSVRLRRAIVGGVVASVALVALGSAVVPASSGADPAGANGTVKIDGLPFDTAPDNQPHVGCRFQVDFYGFDEGDFNAKVIFEVQPPTGQFITIPTNNSTVFIGWDPAGGGTDLDGQQAYNMSHQLAAFPAHPQQGHHVKLTVEAPGVKGKIATKHKVFWTGPCDTGPPSTTTTTTRPPY